MTTQKSVDIWIGLDVGKEFHHAAVLDSNGNALFDRRVDNTEADLMKLFEQTMGYGAPALVIDQPGSIGQLAMVLSRGLEIPIAYVPGLVMRRAADFYPGDSKTDRKDAFVIADTARIRKDHIRWLGIDDDLLVELRVLNGLDMDLAADSTRCSNRIRDALLSISPGLEKVLGNRLQHGGVRDLLLKYPTTVALKHAGASRMKALIAKRSPRLAIRLTAEIQTCLKAQSVSVPAESALSRVISEVVSQLDHLLTRRQVLVEDIEKVFLQHPLGPVLVSLPGMGPRTGARTLAEIGDGSDFANGSKLAAYAGLAPVTRQSGTSIKGQHRSRRGNHRLKNALFLSAFASLHDPNSRAYYDRKRLEGKRHNAALVCLARRRCDVIFAMLRTSSFYDAQRFENPSQKVA